MTTRTPSAIVLAEVEFMLDSGESAARIAEALDMKPGSVARSLERSGRYDIAVLFERARPQRNRQCADCGVRITSPRAQRCRRCGCAHREANKAGRGLAA